jgi:hypothetical protein
MTFPFPILFSRKAPAVLSYVTHLEDTSGSASPSFASAAIGAAAADRLVIVGVCVSKGSGVWSPNPISSVTIGGNAATQVGSQVLAEGTATSVVCLFALTVASGTTATIVVNMAATTTGAKIVIWNATGLSSTTASDTKGDNATPFTQSLTVPSLGFGVGIAGGESVTSWTWTNMTERSDASASIWTASGADTATAGSISVTALNAAGTRAAMVLAAFA